jgi:hypothetical protein
MQRNKQLIHETLELIASESEIFDTEHPQGVSEERMGHIRLLLNSGFLSTNLDYFSRRTDDYLITWQGYDLLDELREVYGELEYNGMG